VNGNDILEKICIPLVATFSGAWLAFRYQHFNERNREKRAVVQILMAYRNVGATELKWIEHMNIIDVVFHDNERVRHLYDEYIVCVKTPELFEKGRHVDVYYEMLYLMCQDCGYTQIMQRDVQKNVYSPNALIHHYPDPIPEFSFHQGPLTKELANELDEISQTGLA